jgi:hypothetical protein
MRRRPREEPDIHSPRHVTPECAASRSRGPLSARNMPFTFAGERQVFPNHADPANRRVPARSAFNVLRVWGDCADRSACRLQSDPVRVQREGDLPWHCGTAARPRRTRGSVSPSNLWPRTSGQWSAPTGAPSHTPDQQCQRFFLCRARPGAGRAAVIRLAATGMSRTALHPAPAVRTASARRRFPRHTGPVIVDTPRTGTLSSSRLDLRGLTVPLEARSACTPCLPGGSGGPGVAPCVSDFH